MGNFACWGEMEAVGERESFEGWKILSGFLFTRKHVEPSYLRGLWLSRTNDCDCPLALLTVSEIT